MKLNRHFSRHSMIAVAALLCMSAEGTATDENVSGTSAPAAAEPVVKAPGIGDIAKQLIRDGLGNKEVLEQVKVQFPEAKTSMASINWYRNHLRDLGEEVKTARELSAAGKPSAEDVKAQKAADKAAEKAAKDLEKAETKAKAKADKEALKAKEKADKAEAKAAAATKAAADAPAAGDDLAAALG